MKSYLNLILLGLFFVFLSSCEDSEETPRTVGANSTTSLNGANCWDSIGDANQDGLTDANDCQGALGPRGLPGIAMQFNALTTLDADEYPTGPDDSRLNNSGRTKFVSVTIHLYSTYFSVHLKEPNGEWFKFAENGGSYHDRGQITAYVPNGWSYYVAGGMPEIIHEFEVQ